MSCCNSLLVVINLNVKFTFEETRVGEDVKKREHSCSVGGTANWCSCYGNSIDVPLKIKNKATL